MIWDFRVSKFCKGKIYGETPGKEVSFAKVCFIQTRLSASPPSQVTRVTCLGLV